MSVRGCEALGSRVDKAIPTFYKDSPGPWGRVNSHRPVQRLAVLTYCRQEGSKRCVRSSGWVTGEGHRVSGLRRSLPGFVAEREPEKHDHSGGYSLTGNVLHCS